VPRLPENLLESELFGHEKGAFTGAVRMKPGLMEIAGGGTLFLDEIGDLPVSLQVKLLRALQERQIRRVGGTALIDVDVRVVSATNRNLREAAAKGQFREELYYRVNVIEIRLPPLRERAGDVRLLAHAFLKRYGQGRVHGYDDAAMTALEAYAWPGNVRELQNIVERACALAEGDTITRRDLPGHLLGAAVCDRPARSERLPVESHLAGTTALGLKEAKDRWMAVLEASYLKELLERNGGNISAAAKAAGIDRKTFHRLINKHQIRSLTLLPTPQSASAPPPAGPVETPIHRLSRIPGWHRRAIGDGQEATNGRHDANHLRFGFLPGVPGCLLAGRFGWRRQPAASSQSCTCCLQPAAMFHGHGAYVDAGDLGSESSPTCGRTPGQADGRARDGGRRHRGPGTHRSSWTGVSVPRRSCEWPKQNNMTGTYLGPGHARALRT
jgi:hypothetical protein